MIDIGVGLWCMRSTAAAPASIPKLYAELIDDARLAEDLGLHSLWLSEHHVWYDGWCPAPLVAAAAVLGATERLHAGTGVLLLPLHDARRIAAAGHELERRAPGRLELGVGLGYRDAELDAVGRSRRARPRLADEGLALLAPEQGGGGPSIWVGGIAERSWQRAAEHSLSLFLPSTMSRRQLRDTIGRAREAAAERGTRIPRVGVLKSAWITAGSGEERRMRELIAAQQREYAGAWWVLRGRLGFDVPDLLEEQMQRAADTALVGPAAALADEIAALEEIGVDLVVLHVASELTRPAYRENMQRIAADLLPALR